jgi:uncharacterized repeat protein (TIGR03803 family)
LIQGADGCLYGTTSGSRNPLLFTNGTVFKLTPQGEVAILASFDFNGTNGYHPSALVQTADRTFYGALQYGGTSPGNGAIFRLTPAGVLTTFFSFSGVNGRRPNILVRGSDGNLYGTTREGGGFGWGTVFKLTPAGELTSLFSFSRTNGINPTSLVRGPDGTLFGTTSDWISVNAPDTVFKLSPSGEFTILLSSFNDSEVFRPRALVQGVDACLYGLDAAGGSNHFGSIFKVTPGGVLTTLVTFDGLNGWDPENLVQGNDGNLYGATEYGGPDYDGSAPSGSGTIFKLSPEGALTTLASNFQNAEGLSLNALVQGADGNLYCATESEAPPFPAGICRLAPQPVVTGLQHFDGEEVLTWTSFTGGSYQVEYTHSPSAADWIVPSPAIIATTNTASVTNVIGEAAQRYYRVRLLP